MVKLEILLLRNEEKQAFSLKLSLMNLSSNLLISPPKFNECTHENF